MTWMTPGVLKVKGGSEDKETFRILIAGDFCPRDEAEAKIVRGEGRDLLQKMEDKLHSAELSIVNVEGPLTEEGCPIPKSGPNIRLHPRSIELLRYARFDVAQLANNHIGDFGPGEVIRTISTLEENGLKTVGAGENLAQARRPTIVETGGLRIGLIALAENEFGLAESDQPGANPLEPLDTIRVIKELSSRVDITLVLIHGGNEYNPVPSPRMKRTYRAFADAGADAVVAGHTHCPQGIEIHRETPIIYSLGNFLFPREQDFRSEDGWWTGYMVCINCTGKEIRSLELIPHRYLPHLEQTVPLTGDEQEQVFDYIRRLSDIACNDQLSEKYWEAWCSMKGASWLRYLDGAVWPLPDKEGAYGDFLSARNAFTCEAHRELIITFFELVRLGRLEEAEKMVPELKKLQVIPGPSTG